MYHPIKHQSGLPAREIQMTKKIEETKTDKKGANLFNTQYNLVILRDEDDQQNTVEEPNPFADDFNYDNWWNRYRAGWLKSETMTDDEIKTRVDEAWECSDYKEAIQLMAEMICRLQK